MQQERIFSNNSTQKASQILNFVVNPNNLLLSKEQDYRNIPVDIRSLLSIKLFWKQSIYLLRSLFLVTVDSLCVVISWISVNQICKLSTENSIFFEELKLTDNDWLSIMLIITVAISFASGIYSTRESNRRIRDSLRACSLSYVVFCTLIFFFDKNFSFNFWFSLILATTYLLNILLISLTKYSIFKVITHLKTNFTPRKVILIGTREDIHQCQQIFKENEIESFKIVETLDLSLLKKNKELDNEEIFNKIYQQIFTKKSDEVFICSWENLKDQTKLFWSLQSSGISWRILPIKQSIPEQNPELAYIGGIPTIRYQTPTIVGINFVLKRIFDIVAATLLLIILGTPMLIIGLLIKLDSPGAIFYKQTRVGLKGQLFQVWKFRTMVENANELQKKLEAKNQVAGGILFKISDDPRITKVGKYLRRYSLDELPQLFNVLRREMSLVGPRPLPIRDVEKFAKHHHFRHEVLPGITGLWQVSGRSNTSSNRVFYYDFRYIENWSLALDVKILLKTVQVVLFSKGAY